MAKKTHEPVKPIEPESNSSGEETDASSDEEPEPVPKKPEDSDSEEVESESGEEEEEPVADPKPITTVPPLTLTKRPAAETSNKSDAKKPKIAVPVPNNAVSKKPEDSNSEEVESETGEEDEEPAANSEPIITVPPLTLTKRPAAESPKKSNAKKPKIAETSEANSSKKSIIQRVFSGADEIAILNGMIEYEAKNNVSPQADVDKFLTFIKDNLQFNASRMQLKGKMGKLKQRYLNSKGKDKSSAKPHDKLTFDLSEKIWGGEKEKDKAVNVSSGSGSGSGSGNASKKGKGSENGKKVVVVEVPNVEVSNGGVDKKVEVSKVGSYFGLNTEEKLVKIGEEMFAGEEKIAGWQEWKKLEREDMELSVKVLDVKRAKMRLVLDLMQ